MKELFSIFSRMLLVIALLNTLSAYAQFGDEVKLTAPDPTGGDRFGISIGVSGDTMVVGASQNRDGGKFGAAYVYVLREGVWTLQTKLLSPDTRPFGQSVAIHENTIVVGG